jgi:hypothetical protein
MADKGRRRDVRGAQNQALFREINEHVPNLAQQNRIDYLCECADEDCATTIELMPGEYQAIRANPRRFAIVPGHDAPATERVVEEHDGYAVVEKSGFSAGIAEKLDPRSRK